jgi:hypothetical protein
MSSPAEQRFSLKEDMASLRRLSIQQEALKSLIIQNSSSLLELSFSGSFLEGSIGSIISTKLGGSLSFAGWDEEEQQQEQDEPENFPESGAPDLVDSDVSDSSLISLAPGVEKPLRSPSEIWEAISDGRTIVTTCSECTAELHCIHNVELVICPDCWIASPIEQSVAGIALECDGIEGCNGVAIGVNARDVVQWLEKNA